MASAGVNSVAWFQRDVRDGPPPGIPAGPGMVVTNPPYGARLDARDAAVATRALVDVMEAALPSWGLCIIAPPALVKRMDVRWDGQLSTRNGGLPVVLAWVMPEP